MNQPRYQLKASDNLTTYEFLSEGPRGKIVKLIQFTTTNYKDVFNLAFGDMDGEAGDIDDKVISAMEAGLTKDIMSIEEIILPTEINKSLD